MQPHSEVSQPGFEIVVRHHVVGGEQTFLRKEYNPPLPPGAALEQILPQPPDANARVQVRRPEAVSQRAQRLCHLFPVGGAQLFHPLRQAGRAKGRSRKN